MWETFISWYINAYLGNYLEDLNSQQLSFALRQGELELENVPLKKNIFRSWGLPIEIQSSIVGRIKIEFNLMKYFRNEPVLISIEDIYLVAGSINLEQWNPLDEEALVIEAKMNSLDAHESRWKAQFDLATNNSSYYSSLYFSSIRIGASLVTKVVENLQLNVRNIHIRFEEEVDGRVIAFGITLDSLNAESCDSKWNPLSSAAASVTSSATLSDCSFKTLQLNNFGIYCDTQTKRFHKVLPQDLKKTMQDLCTNHTYLICPVSAEARITKNNSTHPLTSSHQPRFNVYLTLEKVPLQLTDSQYKNSLRAYKSFKRLRRNCRLRHYRPFEPIKGFGNVKLWWNYAVRALLTIRGYKQRTVLKTWEEILERCKDNVAYVKIYQQHLEGELLTSDLAKIKERIEVEQHFEDIVALREIAMRKVEQQKRVNMPIGPEIAVEVPTSTETSSTSNGGSIFSYIFPSWSRWASSSSSATVPKADLDLPQPSDIPAQAAVVAQFPTLTTGLVEVEDKPSSEDLALIELRKSETEFDEAILDDARSFGSDALLARFNFTMSRSLLTLSRKSGPFLELDVGGVDILTELKPRSGSHNFKMTVASLFLRECSTKSILISPHPFSTKSLSLNRYGNKPETTSLNRDPIFSLLYERKPNKKLGHRIGMTTRPLDLILLPKIWDDLNVYFTNVGYKHDELELIDSGYEIMKQRTREELRRYWEHLISLREGSKEGGLHSNTWEIQLDISAPQIVMHGSVPQSKQKSSYNTQKSLTEDGGKFIVIDLGKFRFTNRSIHDKDTDNVFEDKQAHSVAQEVLSEEDDENEEFLTPCSSPVLHETVTSDSNSISSPRTRERKNSIDPEFLSSDTLGDLQAKLYKKYRLEITDVQVLVVDGKVSSSVKDGGEKSWRTAIARGISSIHLIDRFSINLELQRRLIYSVDPQWPALTLVATLPKLNLHLNETKILTIQLVLNSFLRQQTNNFTNEQDKLNLSQLNDSQLNLNKSSALGGLNTTETPKPKFPKPNAKHFVAQFTIQNITTEIQSCGRSIAELQIIGARTTFTKMSAETNMVFVIHSLLLADAVQTFGPDFELLLASHKHVSMDSVSGSLRDSEPTSPTSPQSPSSPIPFGHSKLELQTMSNQQLAVPTYQLVHEAILTSLEGKRLKSSTRSFGADFPHISSPPIIGHDNNALITAKLVFGTSSEDPVDLHVKFNNLDVIANQETFVEILQFAQRITSSMSNYSNTDSVGRSQSESEKGKYLIENTNIHASFEFSRLSILLLRSVVGKDGSHCARKIATATACDAKVSCSLGDDQILVEGSLGGLQVLNLTAEGQYHQRVVSVGKDLLVDSMYDILKPGYAQAQHHPAAASEIFNETTALTFVYQKPILDSLATPPSFTLRMASVIYTHCPIFLIDIKKCIDQFQAPLATKLKSAAAQIALGLVRQDTGGSGGYNSPVRSLSLSGSLENIDMEELNKLDSNNLDRNIANNGRIQLDVVLDSPVLVLPRSRTSSEVLIANLGQITILGNTDSTRIEDEFSKFHESFSDLTRSAASDSIKYNIFVCDISLFSLDLKGKWDMVENLKMTYPTTSYSTLIRAQELYYCDPSISKPILHNTVVHLSIDYFEDSTLLAKNLESLSSPTERNECCEPKISIQGCVVNSLKLSLTPQQYSQVLDSLDNIASGDEGFMATEVSISNLTERRTNWEKEVHSLGKRRTHLADSMPLPSPTINADESLPIFVVFEIPEVIVELVLPEQSPKSASEIPHLVLSCSELTFDCEKKSFTTELKVTLRSLILEDFSLPTDSAHRILAISKTSEVSNAMNAANSNSSQANNAANSSFNMTEYFRSGINFVSTSCPDLPKSSAINIVPSAAASAIASGSRYFPSTSYSSPSVARTESSSLPDRLDAQDIFAGRFFPRTVKKSTKADVGIRLKTKSNRINKPQQNSSCPQTPPPSPRPFESGENLVQIEITFVDPKSPQFITKYKATHKYTNVEFNTLEIFLSPNTFSHIRRFFHEASLKSGGEINSAVSTNHRSSKTEPTIQFQQPTAEVEVEEVKNSEVKMNIKALRVKLGSAQKTLAKGDVLGFLCHVVNRGNDFVAITGKLGSLEVRDESPFAGLYPVKFVFQGDQALDFDYCRKNSEANFRLAMASVVCVHTQRFYNEFSSLISSMFGLNTFTEEPESQAVLQSNINQQQQRTRVYMNIQAGAPVLLLPYSSSSKSVLVADLGHLSVKNLESSSTYDCISVDLIEMDLYSSVLTEPNDELVKRYSSQRLIKDKSNSNSPVNPSHKIWKLDKKLVVVNAALDNSSYLKDKCALKLKVKRSFVPPKTSTEATTIIEGTLSTVYISLDPEKYKLIRGFLNHNIGENAPNMEQKTVPKIKKLRKRSSMEQSSSAVAAIGSPSAAGSSGMPPTQLELSIAIDLVNVSMELIKDNGEQICQTIFLKSNFTFQSNSDRSKEVGLISQEIVINDARFSQGTSKEQTKNVFVQILQPSINSKKQSQRKASVASNEPKSIEETLQAEIHLRQNVGGSSVSVILNNMRLMVVLDWWMEFHSFLSQEIPLPEEISQTEGIGIKYEPIAVSAGIVSKRAPILDIAPTTFELKINISKCEIVVVEDPAIWDTNAIILKSSAAFHYRPHLEQLVYINLFECELFSCVLGLESETALSIVDPTKNIVLEIIKKNSVESLGILDATVMPTSAKILKIQSPPLCLRLSYYDMKMFIQLVDRFSKDAQAHFLKNNESGWDLAATSAEEGFVDLIPNSRELETLVEMGFPVEESFEVLEHCAGRVEDAALILSSGQHSELMKQKERTGSVGSGQTASSCGGEAMSASALSDSSIKSVTIKENTDNRISGVEFRCMGGISLCVIDDCKDSDVPLIELTISHFEFSQNFAEKLSRVEGILGGDYYNRQLSGWEPFLEPWKCSLTWKQNEYGQLGRITPTREFPVKLPKQEITLNSTQIMNINITSTLLNLYKTVSMNWSEEYSKVDKRRSPFIPFALKNETGSPLWFTTILSSNEEIFRQQKLGTSHPDGTNWLQVNNGRVQPFSFDGRGKLRHRYTHRLKTHQLVVRVDGWQESNPVSVDKVGTYFRTVKPIATQSSSRFAFQGAELPPTRLIFEVSLQGSAQKLVRIRSSLLVKNDLPDPMELKLENTIIYPGFQKAQTGGSLLLVIEPGQVCPVPLHSVCAQMWVRPHRSLERSISTTPSLYMYCTKPMLLGDNNNVGLRTCSPMIAHQIEPYRFCLATKRDEFPTDAEEPSTSTTPTQMITFGLSKRPNLITLKSPLVVLNLLPLEIYFEIKEYGMNCRLPPGKEFPLTNIDSSEYIDILVKIDNFPNGTSIGIQPNSNDFVARMKILDIQKRPLYLSARVERRAGGSVRVTLSCPYWIINKSGIPIICKQEGTSEAAGQFKEHEMGRMVTPLLFSFTDFESTSALSLRVGNSLHGQNSKSQWCRPFPLQRESVRKLAVTISHSQPEIIYLVGVEVKDGKGRYRDTKLVTITPRFLVDNRSSNTVQISQRNYATSFMDPAAEATHLTLPPDCSLPFHWPRLDKDLLLCVRLLNLQGSCWSGGFPIENVDSFHINIRDGDGNCNFLRVEIVVQGPTYVVVFSDTDKLPAPFRIDNLSLVPITFHQSSVGDDRKVAIRAESSCPYAWDEITQQPNITVVAPGGTSAIANMNHLGPVASLTYENFFFIALMATFPKEDGAGRIGRGSGMETMQLVMDVSGSKVILSRKEPGNRNQLWRVNADGLIEHEGSSPPRDHKKGTTTASRLVLDIAGQAPQPSSYIPLMLRKPDTRRASTQHWEFTEDGRLKCANYTNLFVQAKDGFGDGESKREGSWRQWNEIVLGPPQSICFVRTDSGIPVEQAVGRQKLRAGSGRLELQVDTDGPTRVLRIIDVGRRPKGPLLNHIFEENYVNSIPNFVLNLNLQAGVGASLINCQPREELIYMRLFTLILKWVDSKESETVEASVQNFQIDNQQLGAEKPNCVFVTPVSSRYYDSEEEQPALLLSWKRQKTRLDAHVFRNWMLTLKPLSIILEETLLLKFCSWIGLAQQTESLEGLQQEEAEFQIQKAVTNATSLTAKRWYFGLLQIVVNQVRLSVLTASKQTPELLSIKQRLGLTLIRFEEALVELDPFKKTHPFETYEFLLGSIIKHYKEELLSQALLVLGSVDFLGNPVGFVNDVSVGVSGLIHEGSVGILLKNVTHGISNSAAKVTGSLGDGLGRTFTLDDRHELERRKIILESTSSSGDQFLAGIRGFGHGVFGGLTSIFTQTYDGIAADGFPGLISGLGKGIVGTVTKPAVGVLDLAAGAASAIRDSSKTSSRRIPKRMRPTRVIIAGDLLPTFSEIAAHGQELLFEINDRNYNEMYIGDETFKSGIQDLQILISNEHARIIKPGSRGRPVLDIHLKDLIECQNVIVNEGDPTSPLFRRNNYIQFLTRIPDGHLGVARPQVLIENEQIAKKIVQQVNYAKLLFEELKHSLISKSSTNSAGTDE